VHSAKVKSQAKSAPQTEPSTSGDLQHWQYEAFQAHWRDRTIEDAFVTFSLNPDGSINNPGLALCLHWLDFTLRYQDLLDPAEKKP
jgi:hypothetical protein